MQGGVWLGIWIAAVAAGGVCSALSQSLRDLSRTRLEELAAIKNRRAGQRRVLAVIDDIEGHVAAITFPRITLNLICVVAMVLWITALRGAEAPSWVEATIGIAASAILIWIFGSVIPAGVAKHASEETVYLWSPLLRLAHFLSGPLKALSRFFDEVVRRLAGKTERNEAEAMQEELLSVVEEAQQDGQVDQSEKEMIEAVVSFRDTTVGQIMTPRTEIEAIELSNDLGQVTAFIRAGGHSRIPVYQDNLDHIVGVFYVKDLMRWLAGAAPSPQQGPVGTGAGATVHAGAAGARAGRTFDLKALLRPAIFVPETKTVRELLAELLEKRVHIAIVADEYGGTAGLVTFEDIVEEVFGDIQDEYEAPEDEASEVKVDAGERAAEIDARSYVSDVNDAIRVLGVELPESEDYDTVGGFVTVTLGRIPGKGDTLRRDDLLITVLDAGPTRVKRVRLQAMKPAALDDTHVVAALTEASPAPAQPGRS